MTSGKLFPRSAGFWAASLRTSRSGLRRQCRWSSSAKSVESTKRVAKSSSWSTSTALLFAAATGISAYALASMRNSVEPRDLGIKGRVRVPKYATVAEMESAIKEVRVQLDEDTISTDDDDLQRHGYSEWSSTNPDQLPVAVAYPKSTEEVSIIVKICNKYKVPITGYSGGSSLEGNSSSPYGGFAIDFAFMDQIVAFHEDDMDIVVQPSLGWQDLNEAIEKSGLFFPVDPGPSAKIGGMVSTSCSGTNAVRYGTMKDWIINLTCVLADGTVIKTKRRPRKTSAGYNLNSLLCGSEGTLGLVTEITLKLAIIPEDTSVAVVEFTSIRDATETASSIVKAGIPIQCLELLDDVQMKSINVSGATKPLIWKEVPTLFLKFSGTKAGVKENIGRVKAIARAHKGGDFKFAANEKEQKALWSARKEALWSMLSQRTGDQQVWSTDVAVPVSRLADIIEVSKREMDEMGLFASVLGHVGDGNFHESILYDKNSPSEREKVEKHVKTMVDRALAMEGTCTGEHGIGIGKKESLRKEVGDDVIDVMKSLKLSLDPYWLMNPGKIFDVPK